MSTVSEHDHTSVSSSATPIKDLNLDVSNPLLSNSNSSQAFSDDILHLSIRERSSFDIAAQANKSKREKVRTIGSEYLHWISVSFDLYIKEFKNVKFSLQLLKCKILFIRSYYVLAKREKMIISTCVLNIFLAILFGCIIGPSSDNYVAITALFGIGTMLLLLSNVQYLFWIFQNNEVCSLLIYLLLSIYNLK